MVRDERIDTSRDGHQFPGRATGFVYRTFTIAGALTLCSRVQPTGFLAPLVTLDVPRMVPLYWWGLVPYAGSCADAGGTQSMTATRIYIGLPMLM